MGDDCRVDFGDACQVREHAVMELVVRNATAIETEVSLRVERFGVRDATAREATARRRDAADLAAGGRGGGGRDATRGGARARWVVWRAVTVWFRRHSHRTRRNIPPWRNRNPPGVC